jgi:hypothetical protein
LASPTSGFRLLLRAMATTVVPEAEKLDVSGWTAFGTIIDEALKDRPDTIRQLRLFLRIINISALLRHGRFFTSLDPERRTRHLKYFQHHRIDRFRIGLWGLRTMIFMGYYGQTTISAEIGYRPSPAGWSTV